MVAAEGRPLLGAGFGVRGGGRSSGGLVAVPGQGRVAPPAQGLAAHSTQHAGSAALPRGPLGVAHATLPVVRSRKSQPGGYPVLPHLTAPRGGKKGRGERPSSVVQPRLRCESRFERPQRREISVKIPSTGWMPDTCRQRARGWRSHPRPADARLRPHAAAHQPPLRLPLRAYHALLQAGASGRASRVRAEASAVTPTMAALLTLGLLQLGYLIQAVWGAWGA